MFDLVTFIFWWAPDDEVLHEIAVPVHHEAAQPTVPLVTGLARI